MVSYHDRYLTGFSCLQPVTSDSPYDLTAWTIYLFANLQHLFTAFDFSADLLACPSSGPTWVNQPSFWCQPKRKFCCHHITRRTSPPCDHTNPAWPNLGAVPLGASTAGKPTWRWFRDFKKRKKVGPSTLFCCLPRILYLPSPCGIVNKITQINSHNLLAPRPFTQLLPPPGCRSSSRRDQHSMHQTAHGCSWSILSPTWTTDFITSIISQGCFTSLRWKMFNT